MKSLDHGITFVNNLTHLRYKTGVICGDPQCGKSKYAIQLAQNVPVDYIDVLAQLLPNLLEPLGAYDHSSFIKYIEDYQKNNLQGMILDDVEPLLSTFGKERTHAFFRAFSRMESKEPIIVVTHLDKMFAASFTSDRILHLTN